MDDLKKSRNIIQLQNLASKIKEYCGYSLTLRDKEFIYEVYKSLYDDSGKLIKEEMENMKRKQEGSQSNTDTRSVKSTLSYLDVNYKYVMLNKLEAARA